MKRLHTSPLWILLLCWTLVVQAQGQDCDAQLDKAHQYFEDGLLELIPPLLAHCKDFSSETRKEECFALLTRTFYYLGEQWKADAYYLELLKLNPRFLPKNMGYHPEFVQYLDKFYFRKRNLYASAGYNVFSFKVLRTYYDQREVPIKQEEMSEFGRASADVGFAFNLFKSHILAMPGIGVDEVLYKFYGTYDNGFLTGEQGQRRAFGTDGKYYLGRAYLFIQFDRFPFFKNPALDLPTVLKGFYLGGQYYFSQDNATAIDNAIRQEITSPEHLMEDYYLHDYADNFVRKSQFYSSVLGYRLKIPLKKKAWSINIDGRADIQFNPIADEGSRYPQGPVKQDVIGLTNEIQTVFRLGIGLRHERLVPKIKKLK
ncbi:MAG: hypothetical protein KDC44_14950 [Phaeodactylibacter sp.]|nr:hypothetical protein [Phaeodactylibacter sp.]